MIVPSLKSLRLRFVYSRSLPGRYMLTIITICLSSGRRHMMSLGEDQIPLLQYLDSLVLCHGWYKPLPHDENLADSKLKRIHVQICSAEMRNCITSALTSSLTHLSLTLDKIGVISPFEMALRYGINLRSLRIQGILQASLQSQHFRRYNDALPHLSELGIYFGISHIKGR